MNTISFKNSKIKILSLASLTLILSACTSTGPTTENSMAMTTTSGSPAALNSQTSPAKVQAWVANGAIAVQSPNQSGSASYRWRQTSPSNYDILIFGPLGAGSIHLTGNAGYASLTNSKGETAKASSPEALLQQQAGWSMPVANMYYWARGLPAPGSAQTSYNANHQLVRLVQGGWTILYLGYSNVKGVSLPTKIFMNSGHNSVRLSINQWSV